jgi:hypothetical protein
MKRFGAVALLTAVFALPVCAQRSYSRGGFSGHSGTFRGGFSSSRPDNFARASRYAGGRQYFHSAPMYRGRSFDSFRIRPGYDWNRLYRPRRRRVRRYGTGTYYAVPEVTGWIGADYLDYSDDLDFADTEEYNSSASPPDYAEQGYEGEPELRPWPTLYGSNQPTYAQSRPALTPENEEAVTLVFKDGRPSERIYNYAMTTSTLYVLDTPHRTIPLDQLNLTATEKINDAASVSFQLPQATK